MIDSKFGIGTNGQRTAKGKSPIVSNLAALLPHKVVFVGRNDIPLSHCDLVECRSSQHANITHAVTLKIEPDMYCHGYENQKRCLQKGAHKDFVSWIQKGQ